MARQGISKEDIWTTARALETAGRRVTVSAVREHLGTGSFTTIQNALAEYRDQAIEKVSAAPDMPDQIRSLSEQLWAACWAEFENQHGAERAAVAERVAKAEEEKTELLGEIQHLEQTYEVEIQNTAEVLQELNQEREERARIEGEMTQLLKRFNDMERLANARQLEISDLKAEIKKKEEEAQKTISANWADAAQRIKKANEERDEETKKLTATAAKASAAETALRKEKENATRLETRLDSLERQVKQTIEAKDKEIDRLMELVRAHAEGLEAATRRRAPAKKKATPKKTATVI